MTQDDHSVISLDEARRRRRARELRDEAERAGREDPVRISDAMSHLLEDDEDPAPPGGPSAEHLRLIVEREFTGDAKDAPGSGDGEPSAAAGPSEGGDLD